MAEKHEDAFKEFDAASRNLAEVIQNLMSLRWTAAADTSREIGRYEASRAWELYLRIRHYFAYGTLSAIDDWEPLLASFGNPADVVELHQSSDERFKEEITWPTAHGMAVALLQNIAYTPEMHVEPDGEQTEQDEVDVAVWLGGIWFVREPIQLQRLHCRIVRERACAAAHFGIDLIGAVGFRGSKASEEPMPFTRQHVAEYTELEVSSLTDRAKEWGTVIVKAAKGRPEVRDYREARESLKAQFPHKKWPETPPW